MCSVVLKIVYLQTVNMKFFLQIYKPSYITCFQTQDAVHPNSIIAECVSVRGCMCIVMSFLKAYLQTLNITFLLHGI